MEVVDNLDVFLGIFPDGIVPLDQIRESGDSLVEVVLDYGRSPVLRFDTHNQFLPGKVTREELDAIISRVGDFADDNRAGIEGTLHRISAIRNRRGEIIGLTCRVGRFPRYMDHYGDGCLLCDNENLEYVLDKPGAYIIKNTENGQFYVGSSNKIRRRMLTHRRDLRKGVHHCAYLQRAYQKYGESSFKFAILRYCTVEESRKMEQRVLDVSFSYNYNAMSSTTPYKWVKIQEKHGPLSEKTREKLREARKHYIVSEKTRKKLSESHKGIRLSDEAKEKVRISSTGRPKSAETRKKLSDACKSKGYAGISAMREHNDNIPFPTIIGPDGTIYAGGVCITKFCRERGLSQGNMSEVIAGRRAHHKGFRLYVKEDNINE